MSMPREEVRVGPLRYLVRPVVLDLVVVEHDEHGRDGV
jgi:hypothetical protein